MTAAGEAIPAMATNNVTFRGHQFALPKIAHCAADLINDPDKLVPDHHRYRNRLLGPGVPIIYVNVRTADRSFLDADEDVVRPDFGHRDFLEIESRFALSFHQGRHRFAHSVQTR